MFERICAWLRAEGVAFRTVHHAPTRTSAESAAARGEPLEVGAKALLVKVDEVMRLVVISAALQLDAKLLRSALGAKRSRFATADELLAQTGLVPGSVPPFGPPVLPFDLCVDESIPRLDRVAFNAGSLCDSIIMRSADYLRVARPRVIACAAAG